MKILCNVCEAAEATVFCCADEAALCCACDETVHAVNKLAIKHQRLSLSTFPSHIPKCDVCQEAVGYFFCLEDRALLCRKCDVSIHTANDFVASHRRFLLTGVKLGFEIAEPEPGLLSQPGKMLEPDIGPVSEKQLPKKVSEIEDLVGNGATGSIREWQFDEFLALADGNDYLSYTDIGSSKVGDSDSFLISSNGELDGDDYFSQVPDASWTVPEFPSSDIASNLYVPDISGSPLRNLYDDQYQQQQGPNLKNPRLF